MTFAKGRNRFCRPLPESLRPRRRSSLVPSFGSQIDQASLLFSHDDRAIRGNYLLVTVSRLFAWSD